VLIRSSRLHAPPGFFDKFEHETYVRAIATQLKRRGVPVRLDPVSTTPLGMRREYDDQSVRVVLSVAILDSVGGTRLDEPGGSLVAYWGTPWAERLRIPSRLSALDAAHAAGAIPDIAYYVERVRLTKAAVAIAVFAGPLGHGGAPRSAR
jgi:hypothetical protein